MKRNLVLGAGRGPRVEVLERIKRSARGMTVNDLSDAMVMSYMGVKAHCAALASAGYLTTWRQPAPKGRPYLFYRLSETGERFFSDSKGEVLALDLLVQARALFGPTAPQKLLMMYFRSQAQRYREQIDQEGEVSPVDRARHLVRLREREGRMSSLITETENHQIRESHNTLADLMKAYPESCAMEEQMMGEVLGASVNRRDEEGTVCFSFRSAITES
jgi:predicted ArsR family transcriptional regulator